MSTEKIWHVVDLDRKKIVRRSFSSAEARAYAKARNARIGTGRRFRAMSSAASLAAGNSNEGTCGSVGYRDPPRRARAVLSDRYRPLGPRTDAEVGRMLTDSLFGFFKPRR